MQSESYESPVCVAFCTVRSTAVNESITQEYCLSRRCRSLNGIPIRRGKSAYVLCWLQQTLRGECNPVIDAAVALGNSLSLPVVVYHGLGQHYPYASDRLHHFILEASRSMEQDVIARGLRFIRVIECPTRNVKGVVYQLAAHAAALIVDDNAAFVGRWQSQRVALKLERAVITVDGARLVPELVLGAFCPTTPLFRARVNAVREHWLAEPLGLSPTQRMYSAELAARHDAIGPDDTGISQWVDQCDIDHSLPPVRWCQGDRASALSHLAWAAVDVIPRYAAQRNNPALTGVSYLSPYLHFGVLGPHDVARLACEVDSSRGVWKYLDELLVWREYFHHVAHHTQRPNHYEGISPWARESLNAHANDTRDQLYSLSDLIHGRTHDETWNVAQRQFLNDGWMHNNLRMYWGKRLIGWTATPERAWATACYLNDRFSLDGRDPATYGNLRWCFGGGRPAAEIPVYGRVPRKTDAALRRRPGVAEWLSVQAERRVAEVFVPDTVPVVHYPQASGHPAPS